MPAALGPECCCGSQRLRRRCQACEETRDESDEPRQAVLALSIWALSVGLLISPSPQPSPQGEGDHCRRSSAMSPLGLPLRALRFSLSLGERVGVRGKSAHLHSPRRQIYLAAPIRWFADPSYLIHEIWVMSWFSDAKAMWALVATRGVSWAGNVASVASPT